MLHPLATQPDFVHRLLQFGDKETESKTAGLGHQSVGLGKKDRARPLLVSEFAPFVPEYIARSGLPEDRLVVSPFDQHVVMQHPEEPRLEVAQLGHGHAQRPGEIRRFRMGAIVKDITSRSQGIDWSLVYLRMHIPLVIDSSESSCLLYLGHMAGQTGAPHRRPVDDKHAQPG